MVSFNLIGRKQHRGRLEVVQTKKKPKDEEDSGIAVE